MSGLVGEGEQTSWNGETERAGDVEVDDELNLVG
jgi:hypothetical protein